MDNARVHRSSNTTVLYDSERTDGYDETWFDRSYWQRHGELIHSTMSRGSVFMLKVGADAWVLRHYHRGGLVAHFVYDHYLWLGLERSRAFREWRLLYRLHAAGLPVPSPIAARVSRRGPVYQADIVTEYLPDTRTLSAYLNDGGLDSSLWLPIGEMVRGFHDYGVDHPDLTAHNILLDSDGGVFLVDFDNAVLKPRGAWQQAGMARLQRSLRKVTAEMGTVFDENARRLLEQGYAR